MKTQREYIEILTANSKFLNSEFGITYLCIFGSVARNEQHEGSDVDIFVKMPPKIFNAIAAEQYLEELLGCKVDLISDHQNLKPFFRNQIEKYGIEIFRAA